MSNLWEEVMIPKRTKTLKNKKTGEVLDVVKVEKNRVYVNSQELSDYGYISDWYIPEQEIKENYEVE